MPKGSTTAALRYAIDVAGEDKAAQALKQIETHQERLQKRTQSFASGTMPAATSRVTGFRGALQKLGPQNKAAGRQFGMLANTAAETGFAVGQAIPGMRQFSTTLAIAGGSAFQLGSAFGPLVAGIGATVTVLPQLISMFTGTDDAAKNAEEGLSESEKAMREVGSAAVNAAPKVDTFATALKNAGGPSEIRAAAEAISKRATAIKEESDARHRLQSVLEGEDAESQDVLATRGQLLERLRSLQQQRDNLKTTIKSGATATRAEFRALSDLEGQIQDVKKQLGEAAFATEQQTRFAKALGIETRKTAAQFDLFATDIENASTKLLKWQEIQRRISEGGLVSPFELEALAPEKIDEAAEAAKKKTEAQKEAAEAAKREREEQQRILDALDRQLEKHRLTLNELSKGGRVLGRGLNETIRSPVTQGGRDPSDMQRMLAEIVNVRQIQKSPATTATQPQFGRSTNIGAVTGGVPGTAQSARQSLQEYESVLRSANEAQFGFRGKLEEANKSLKENLTRVNDLVAGYQKAGKSVPDNLRSIQSQLRSATKDQEKNREAAIKQSGAWIETGANVASSATKMAESLGASAKAIAATQSVIEFARGIADLASGTWPPNPAAIAASAAHFAAGTTFATVAGKSGGGAPSGGGSAPSGRAGGAPPPEARGGGPRAGGRGGGEVTNVFNIGTFPVSTKEDIGRAVEDVLNEKRQMDDIEV